MKLKPVALFLMAGVFSSTVAFAATDATTTSTTTTASSTPAATSTTTTTVKKHHRRRHRRAQASAVAPATTTAVQTPVTQAQLDATNSRIAQLERMINANDEGVVVTPTGDRGHDFHPDWYNRIAISGLANIDTTFANRDPAFSSGVNNGFNRIALNTADLYIDATLNDYVKTHIGFQYSNNLTTGSLTQNTVNLEEAYATIGNFAMYPVYLRAGKEVLPYGQFDRHPIIPTTAQMLTQTTDVAATLGFVADNGFNGSVSGFQGPTQPQVANYATKTQFNDFTAHVGYTGDLQSLNMQLGLDYINNVGDTDYMNPSIIASQVQTVTVNNASVIALNNVNKVGGLAAYALFRYNAFDFGGHYATALTSFNYTAANQYGSSATLALSGVKPSAWDAGAGYSFATMGYDSRFGLSYQGSKNAAAIRTTVYDVPKSRYAADYTVNLWTNTQLGLELRRDKDYSVADGGTGNFSNAGVIRLAVQFA